ncbi:MAG TPA: DUF2851 family protein, partial [Cytophagaceae bacterium]
MKEDFLHYIWQYQYFDKSCLCTEDAEPITILSPGTRNPNAGADFTNARIKVGEVEWFGNVEIHIKSSDWKAHQHHQNPAYLNTILHVVYQNESPAYRSDGTAIPVIAIGNRIDKGLIQKYEQFISTTESIPCASGLSGIPTIVRLNMLDKVLYERLEQKAELVRELNERNNKDWEETSYQLLARNFGFKLNNQPFLNLSKSLPLKALLKHRGQLEQVEAMIFGQAGFLEDDLDDNYYKALQREYRFLAHKYQLADKRLKKEEWKFLRVRPGNFPSLRLAELASLINSLPGLFSYFIECSAKELKDALSIKPSNYWYTHYDFGKETERHNISLGQSSVENLIINTVVPLLVCYSKEKSKEEILEKAVRLLETLKPEDNHIIRDMKLAGFQVANAFDSQAVIQ